MSSNATAVASLVSSSMSNFQYRSTDVAQVEEKEVEVQEEVLEPEITLTEESLQKRLATERAAGFADAESKLRHEFEHKAELRLSKISGTIVNFESERSRYFTHVEAEVVQLALAIAGKILHREAQVDPMLLTAIVHVALGQLKEGSAATIRVRPEEANKWVRHFDSQPVSLSIKVAEDGELESGDCILETELGTVNFNLDAQLKEVERGFFDVLAQKPKP